MQVQLRELKHPKDDYRISFDKLIDVDPLFKHRDDNRDRDFCTYEIYDENGILVYIGEGRYWHLIKYTFKKFISSRPFSHKNDLVGNYCNNNWTFYITSFGVTKIECQVLEAYFIRKAINSGFKLSKMGTKEWDGDSLMNKNKGRSDKKYLYLKEEWLNV